MSWQTLIRDADPEALESFRKMIRHPPILDHDDVALADCMLSGFSPWQAAGEVLETSSSDRSRQALYSRAQRVKESILSYLGQGLDSRMVELLSHGETVLADPLLLTQILKRAQKAGLEVELVIRTTRRATQKLSPWSGETDC